MAHDIHTKARAMADLLTGEAVRDVAAAEHIPQRTVRRWRAEAWAMVDSAVLGEVAAIWPTPCAAAIRVQPCGARTRASGLCQAPATANGRCRMHGGTVKQRGS